MLMRMLSVPVLAGGAMALGYAALAFRSHHVRRKIASPSGSEAPAAEPEGLETLELDWDDEDDEEDEASVAASSTDSTYEDERFDESIDAEQHADDFEAMAPEDIGAHWLGRATEAMSPLHSRPHTNLRDVFRRDEGAVSEGTLVSAGRITHPSIDEDDLEDSEESPRR